MAKPLVLYLKQKRIILLNFGGKERSEEDHHVTPRDVPAGGRGVFPMAGKVKDYRAVGYLCVV